MEVRDEPEEERKHDADDEAGHDREVERGVFAAVNDVAGQFSQAEWQLVPEIKKEPNQDEEPSEEEKRTAEFAKRVHKAILPELPNKSWRTVTYYHSHY